MQPASYAPPAAANPPTTVSYLCGDCGAENTLRAGDVIQCRECGYRILYKKRTKNVVQYEARCGGLSPVHTRVRNGRRRCWAGEEKRQLLTTVF